MSDISSTHAAELPFDDPSPAPAAANRGWRFMPVVLLFLVLLSAQVAMPLTEGRVAGLSTVTICALALMNWYFGALSWGFVRFTLVTLTAGFVSFAIELYGVEAGVPFGQYWYTDRLQPQLLGVPLLVPLAWAAMIVPAWELARRITPGRSGQAMLTGAGMVVWDLLLDPQMTRYGFWEFADTVGWRGIPFTNFAGWFVSGTLLALIPMTLQPARANVPNNGHAFLYVWMIGFSALGFLIPFALDDPAVGVVGTLFAAPYIHAALRRKDRSWLA